MLKPIDATWLRTLAAPHGSGSNGVLGRMAVFALIATAVCLLDRAGHGIRTPVGYHEVRDDPFGNDPNDLPLSRICAKLEHDLLGIEPPPGNAPAYLDD